MLSPFYILICILAIISPINAYNREFILKDISIENEVLIVCSGVLIIFYLSQLIRKNSILPKNIKSETVKYLIINIFLASTALFMSGYILKHYDVLRFKSLQKPIYLFFLVIIACLIYRKKCNFQVILGIGLLIGGCVLVDRNLK